MGAKLKTGRPELVGREIDNEDFAGNIRSSSEGSILDGHGK
jgi:hypothetical protein